MAGCDRVPGTEAFAIRIAEQRVAALLIDPTSALFTEVETFGAQHERVCGQVNARNRMGGYVGASRFVSTPSLTLIEPGDEDDAFDACLFRAAHAFNCSKELGPAIATAGC